MERLYRQEGENIYAQPMRTVLRADNDSIFLSMPALSKKLERFAVKIVTEFKRNPVDNSLPVQGGLILLMDARNAQVLATLDSPSVTAIRTGAVSGLATKLLAREGVETVGVVGSGQQAETQLEAVCAVRPIRSVNVYSRSFPNAQRFAFDMSKKLGIEVKPKQDRKEALCDAGVVIVATNSAVPVVSWSEIPPGAHVNSIGTLPERRELDVETVCNSGLYVDSKEGVLKEAGDIMYAISSGRISASHIKGDLSDLVLGRVGGRNKDSDPTLVTLFKSVGFALQDVYASSYVFDKFASREQRERSK